MTKETIEINWKKIEEEKPPIQVAIMLRVRDLATNVEGITYGTVVETEEGLVYTFSILQKEIGGLVSQYGYTSGRGECYGIENKLGYKLIEWAELPNEDWFAL